MTGKINIINIGGRKGRGELVEEKEIDSTEEGDVGKRGRWEDAEWMVMNEKSGSVKTEKEKERAESLIEEPTGRKVVGLGTQEERRNNTNSIE
jgi:hypothetical protein